MTIAETLYQLQQIDDTIRARKRRLAEVEGQLGESESLRKARSDFVAAEAALQELEKMQRLQELELETVGDKLRSEESRLYGGRVKNPKELAGLQKEVRYLKQRHAELEDNLLETMLAREEATSHVAERKTILDGIEGAWQRDQSDLLAEREQLQAAIAEANDQRKELVHKIPAHVLNTYDHLIRTKGSAVAPVESGMCTGCRVSLSAVDRQRVLGDELTTCSNCDRILVVV